MEAQALDPWAPKACAPNEAGRVIGARHRMPHRCHRLGA